jgi:hypothetical protein
VLGWPREQAASAQAPPWGHGKWKCGSWWPLCVHTPVRSIVQSCGVTGGAATAPLERVAIASLDAKAVSQRAPRL